MSQEKDEYPLASLHSFLEEASKEFRRFRFQSTVNLIGSIIILLFVSRFLVFLFGNYGPPPFNPGMYERGPPRPLFVPDLILLLASLVAVLWSFDVWRGQHRFVSRWGERFEKLEALERRFLPDETK